jgi:hypothetical protein
VVDGAPLFAPVAATLPALVSFPPAPLSFPPASATTAPAFLTASLFSPPIPAAAVAFTQAASSTEELLSEPIELEKENEDSEMELDDIYQ